MLYPLEMYDIFLLLSLRSYRYGMITMWCVSESFYSHDRIELMHITKKISRSVTSINHHFWLAHRVVNTILFTKQFSDWQMIGYRYIPGIYTANWWCNETVIVTRQQHYWQQTYLIFPQWIWVVKCYTLGHNRYLRWIMQNAKMSIRKKTHPWPCRQIVVVLRRHYAH